MSLPGIMNMAVSGMQAQTTRLHVAANNIANTGTEDYRAQQSTTIALPENGTVRTIIREDSEGYDFNLSAEFFDTINAATAFTASALVFETGADLWDVLKSMKRD